MINDSTAADGTVVTATVAGQDVASTSVSQGRYIVDVPPPLSSDLSITFKVGSLSARQSAKWEQGGVTSLNLTASDISVEFDPRSKALSLSEADTLDIVVRNFHDTGGLGSYDITFTYDESVINVVSPVGGGDAPFHGAPTCSIDNNAGQVDCVGFQGSAIPGPTGDIRIAVVTLDAVGTAGDTTDLSMEVNDLTDTAGTSIPAAGVNGEVKLVQNAAEPSFTLFQDPVDGATGLKLDVTRVFDPGTGATVPMLLGAFHAYLAYDPSCINVLAVRELDFQILGVNINNTKGLTEFVGISPVGVPASVTDPADLGHALTRLVGNNRQTCTVTMVITDLIDTRSTPIVVNASLVQRAFRGDARADGNISVADPLFIAQSLVGLRDTCDEKVHDTCLHAVNTASVRQDGDFDQVTIADALFIAQFLVGLRDESYEMVP